MPAASSLPPSAGQLLVSEKFVSLQGEGLSTGAPSAFLRLGNCNLTCGYCDTAYTWDDTRFDLSRELRPEPVTQVAAWVRKNAPGRLIITGGEPLLQQKLLVQLLADLSDLGSESLFVEVETNGTVVPHDALLRRVNQFNVSPKLSNSGEPADRRFKDKALRAFFDCERANFKFVVVGADETREVDAFVQRWGIAPERVCLMPEAQSAETLRARAPSVASAAASRRYRYSGRLHLELFGGRRGT